MAADRRTRGASRSERSRPGVLQYLLDETRFDPAELETRVSRAVRPAYWKELCPALSVGKLVSGGTVETDALGPRHRQELARRLAAEGYFETGPLLPQARVRRMRHAVTSVKNAGWPPVFAFVYDEFWTVWQLPSLTNMIAAALGPDFRMRANLWCYYVHPVPGARGWPPHADDFGTRGVTVWIPLTDATLENGCMYVIPKDLVPRTVHVERLFRAKTLPISSFTHLMQCARALPARAGSILGWDSDVIHWGGVARRPTSPRISVSAEFVCASDRPGADGSPLVVAAPSMPSFTERLRVIAQCIGLFGANDTWTFRYQDLGRKLADTLSGDPAVRR